MTSLMKFIYFGPDLAGVRGNTARKKPIMVDTEDYVKINEDFYNLYKFVKLMADVIFFNRNHLIIKPARKLKPIAINRIPILTSGQLSKILNKAIKFYGRGGFIICMIFIEMELKKVAEMLGKAEVNILDSREHIREE